MTEEIILVQKQQQKFIEKHSSKIGDELDLSLKMRDEFAAENTYKFSDLIITIAVGIVGVASLSNLKGLQPLSKFFTLSLVFPLFVIAIELFYRYKVIEVNRDAYHKRSEAIKENLKLSEALMSKPLETFVDLFSATEKIFLSSNSAYEKINQLVRSREPELFRLRKISLALLVLSLLGLVLTIFSESGILKSFHEFLTPFFDTK